MAKQTYWVMKWCLTTGVIKVDLEIPQDKDHVVFKHNGKSVHAPLHELACSEEAAKELFRARTADHIANLERKIAKARAKPFIVGGQVL